MHCRTEKSITYKLSFVVIKPKLHSNVYTDTFDKRKQYGHTDLKINRIVETISGMHVNCIPARLKGFVAGTRTD